MAWRPIASEPRDDLKRLVTNDPSDPSSAHLVTLRIDGKHHNGAGALEDAGYMPTHWHPIPVMMRELA